MLTQFQPEEEAEILLEGPIPGELILDHKVLENVHDFENKQLL